MSLFAKRATTATAQPVSGTKKIQQKEGNQSQSNTINLVHHSQHFTVGEGGESNKEKLLFLLQVASDPSLASEVSNGSCMIPQNSPTSSLFYDGRIIPSECPGLTTLSNKVRGIESLVKNDEVDEEEIKKKRRIQYALSVLNSSREESEARMHRAIMEAKEKRMKRAISSLTKNSAAASSSVPSATPNCSTTRPLACNPVHEKRLPSKVAPKNAQPNGNHAQHDSAKITPGHLSPLSIVHTMKKAPTTRKSTFPEKLMDVLSRKDTEDAITWYPDGKSFVIISPKIFATEVLPRFFKQAKFESFTRKLNRWGFARITKGGNAIAFSHEYFIRDKPHLCKHMGGGKKYEAKEPETKRQEALRDHMSVIGIGDPLERIPSSNVSSPPFMLQPSLTGLLQRSLQRYLKSDSKSLIAQELPRRAVTTASMAEVSEVASRLVTVAGKTTSRLLSLDENLNLEAEKPSTTHKGRFPSQGDHVGVESTNVPQETSITNETLSRFYERKIQEISSRYNNQAASYQVDILPRPMTTAAMKIPPISWAEQKKYLSMIRAYRTPLQNVIGHSAPSSASMPCPRGGAA